MDPLTHSITCNRAVPDPAVVLEHWQASALRCVLSMESGKDLTGAESIVVELHTSQKSDPGTVLASVILTLTEFEGPWIAELTAAQMNQTIPAARTYSDLWMAVAAIFPNDRPEVLAVRTVRLHRSNFSGTTPPPPAPSLFLTSAAAAALYATLTALADLEARVAEIEENGVGGGVADLVVRIVTATETATDTALHLAYVPLALTVPAASSAGFHAGLQSHTPGTVKFVLPAGFEITYDDLPAGRTGRPVVAYRGGRIDCLITAPNRILIRGDYVSTASAWHPTDAGDDLLGYWQAGPSLVQGGHVSFPCADTEAINFTSDLLMRWEATFGSRANARWLYDWLGNTDSGGDQGTSPISYAPGLVADAAFAGGYAYILREGSANVHVMRARDDAGDMVLTAPCRIFLALRQTSTGMSPTTLLRINSLPAYVSSTPGGLQWRGAPWGYQFLHSNESGSFGAKGGTFATHEDTLSAILLTLVISANGGGTIYSGTTQVSAPLTVTSAAVMSYLQFYAGQNLRLGGVAVINGTAANLSAEIQAMASLLIA